MPPGCTADSSRRFRMRTATSTAHSRLDALVETGGFLKRLDRYRSYLHATYRARAAAEAGLDAAGVEQVYAAWPSRRIAETLHADLADLEPAVAPAPIAPLRFRSAPAALGGLYVLEGSALGARLLSKEAARLGLGPGFGARHMHAQIGDPAAWRRFVEALERHPMTEAEERDCVAGAAAVFACFEHELSAQGELV